MWRYELTKHKEDAEALLFCSATTLHCSSSSNIYDIMVVTNLSNFPHGVSGKEPPLNRVQPNQSLPEPPMLDVSGDNPGRSIQNLDLFRQMVELTKHGNKEAKNVH